MDNLQLVLSQKKKELVTLSTICKATSHTRLRAHDHCTSSTLIGGKGGGVQVCLALPLRDQLNTKWMHDGCKVCMNSYMASNGSCFKVTWFVFKNYLLKVSLTQNQETIALQNLTTIDLLQFIMCADPA